MEKLGIKHESLSAFSAPSAFQRFPTVFMQFNYQLEVISTSFLFTESAPGSILSTIRNVRVYNVYISVPSVDDQNGESWRLLV